MSAAPDLRLRPPFSAILYGASQSGKTTFLASLLRVRHNIISEPVGKIYYFYNTHSALFDELEEEHGISFIRGVVDMEWLEENIGLPGKRKSADLDEGCPLIIVDDQGLAVSESTQNVFTVGVHHYHLALFFCCHAVFTNRPEHRIIGQNANYIQVFKNARNYGTVSALARQIDPGRRSGRLVRIYQDACRKPFSYLFIDCTQLCPEDYRLRSNILFEDGEPCVIFKRHN